MSYVPLGVVETMAERALRLGPGTVDGTFVGNAVGTSEPRLRIGTRPCAVGTPLVPGSRPIGWRRAGAGRCSATAQRVGSARIKTRTARAKPGPSSSRRNNNGPDVAQVRGGGYGTRVLVASPASYRRAAGLSVVNGGAANDAALKFATSSTRGQSECAPPAGRDGVTPGPFSQSEWADSPLVHRQLQRGE